VNIPAQTLPLGTLGIVLIHVEPEALGKTQGTIVLSRCAALGCHAGRGVAEEGKRNHSSNCHDILVDRIECPQSDAERWSLSEPHTEKRFLKNAYQDHQDGQRREVIVIIDRVVSPSAISCHPLILSPPVIIIFVTIPSVSPTRRAIVMCLVSALAFAILVSSDTSQ
jgi:hypothetical protein